MKGYADLLKELQQKFVSTDITAGLLGTEQANRFIDLLVDESALLSAVTVQRVDQRAGELYTIDITDRVLTGGQENTEVTPDTGTLSFGKIDYSCFKLSTGFALTWETLHWNIEGEDFEDHLVRLWREAMRRDLEILALRGDTSSADDFLKLDDGWVAQLLDPANGAHIVDFHDDTGNPQTVDATLFQKAIKALPTKYALRDLRWIATPKLIYDYRHYLASRQDNLGAAVLMGRAELTPEGIPFFGTGERLGVPYLPEDLGTGNNETVVILADPKVFWFIVHREFRLESERVPSKDRWEFYGHGYFDFIVSNFDAVVIVKGVTYA